MNRKTLSLSAAVILQAIAHGYPYGFDIMDVTGFPSGTVYPALRRLEDLGYVRSKWENAAIAQKELRPPRKYYEMTSDGESALREATGRYTVLGGAGKKKSRRGMKPSRASRSTT